MEKKTAAQLEAEIKAAQKAYDEFEVKDPSDVQKSFDLLKTLLELKGEGQVKNFEEKMAAIEAAQVEAKAAKEEEMKTIGEKLDITIKALDVVQARVNDRQMRAPEKHILSLEDAVVKAFSDLGVKEIKQGVYEIPELEKALKSASGSIRLPLGPVDLKAQGSDMTTANSLTGDPMRTYSMRQGLQPGALINFRDLMPTVQSPTGTFVTYTEDTGETNNITTQTEGNTKGQNQYTLTEKINTNNYIAGFSVFAKQLVRNLPFLQGTLPRLLLRDFYLAENSIFFTAVSGAATGPTSMGSSPDDVKQLIYAINGFLNTRFKPAYIVVNPILMGRLLTSTYTSGYYPGAGAVNVNSTALISPINIQGVPVFAADWVTANYALMVDADYLERVETEGLKIAFSYEDASNFRQNKVTARIECQESVNLMLAPAACYLNLGAS